MSLKRAFPEAIDHDLGVAAYRPGLQALKREDQQRVNVSEPRDCHGSADIDKALLAAYPNEPRWDYVLAHRETVHFVEVHPAHTSAVREVRRKRDWLKRWLQRGALGQLRNPQRFHWIASGKVAITPNSRQNREAAMMGLKPARRLSL